MPTPVPPLIVSRLVAACSRCRQAKTRCDGKLPACSACERLGKADKCSNTNDDYAKGKERSYVITLETRLEKLQKQLEEAQQRKAASPSSQPNAPHARPPSAARTSSSSRSHARDREAVEIDNLVADFGTLSVSANARDFHGFTQTMSYARLVLAAATREPLPSLQGFVMPSRAQVKQVADTYFNTIHQLLPFFEKTSFFLSLEAVHNSTRGGDVVSTCDAWDYWVVFMVLAIGHVSMSERPNDGHYNHGVAFAATALRYAEPILRPGSLRGIHAMLLLCQYALYDSCHFDIWTLVGVASRAMVDLGIHQDPSRSSGIRKNQIQVRQSIYHAIYVLDRYCSMAYSRALSFSDDSTNVNIPLRAASSSMSDTSPGPQSGPFSRTMRHADIYRIRQIQSVWYHELFQSSHAGDEGLFPYIWEKYRDMQDWFDALPPNMEPYLQALFEIELCYGRVLLLASPPTRGVPSDYAASLAFENCIQYSNLISAKIREPSDRFWLTSVDLLRIAQVGRHFVDILTSAQGHLLEGNPPRYPYVPASTVAPPSFPYPPRSDNVRRSVACINQITDSLQTLGFRFRDMTHCFVFGEQVQPMLVQLTQLDV